MDRRARQSGTQKVGMLDKYQPGRDCTLDRTGDLYCEYESREFIGEPCTIVKRTKAGLIQVALKKDPKKTYSAPQKNIVITY